MRDAMETRPHQDTCAGLGCVQNTYGVSKTPAHARHAYALGHAHARAHTYTHRYCGADAGRIEDLDGLGCRVQGAGCRVQGAGFRIYCLLRGRRGKKTRHRHPGLGQQYWGWGLGVDRRG
jgi:hypothetical protein